MRDFLLLLHLQQLRAEIKEAVSFHHFVLQGTLSKLLTAAIEVTHDLCVEASVLFRAVLTLASSQKVNFSVLFLDVSLTAGIFEDVPDRFSALVPDLEQIRCLSD